MSSLVMACQSVSRPGEAATAGCVGVRTGWVCCGSRGLVGSVKAGCVAVRQSGYGTSSLGLGGLGSFRHSVAVAVWSVVSGLSRAGSVRVR